MLQRTLGSGWGVLLPGLLIAGLMYATIVPGAYCCHHADDNEFESGMKNQGRNKKGSKDNWCEGGDLNPHVRKDTNT